MKHYNCEVSKKWLKENEDTELNCENDILEDDEEEVDNEIIVN